MITRTVIEKKIISYLNRHMTLAELVDWSEKMMMEGEFDVQDSDLLTEIVARLGLADIREFGLSWDDCYEFLARLGYRVSGYGCGDLMVVPMRRAWQLLGLVGLLILGMIGLTALAQA